MSKYIINKNPQEGWEHEFHNEETCEHLPLNENRVLIWYYNTCEEAKEKAESNWPSKDIDWCYWCTSCHTK